MDFSQAARAHTSLGRLECLALAGWPLPLVVQHPDGDVVDAVGLQAWQAALAAVPRERQRLLRLLALPLGLVQAALATVGHLESRGLRELVTLKGCGHVGFTCKR